jgi:hypothetical protein
MALAVVKRVSASVERASVDEDETEIDADLPPTDVGWVQTERRR